MDELRRVAPRLRFVAALACMVVATALPVRVAGAGAHEFDITGSWHLLVHYKDAASENPDAERWDERLWRFERRGSRMQWSEFDVVVFDDRAGRFEPFGEARLARTLGFWEPNEAQLAEIRAGLRVGSGGPRSKGLRGDSRSGFRSVSGLATDSVSAIGYSESWRVEGLPGAPIFSQDASMGSGRTEKLHGHTRYTSERVSEDGNEVHGSFVRDGTRRGKFILRRSGPAALVAREPSRKPSQ